MGGRVKPRRGPTQEAKLQALYAQVPEVGCKGLCEASCGSVTVTAQEQQRIRVRHGVNLPRHGAFIADDPAGRCPALVDQRCSIYEDRPFICRLWGAEETMPCEHGCRPAGGLLPHREGMRIAQAVLRLGGHDPHAEARASARASNQIREALRQPGQLGGYVPPGR